MNSKGDISMLRRHFILPLRKKRTFGMNTVVSRVWCITSLLNTSGITFQATDHFRRTGNSWAFYFPDLNPSDSWIPEGESVSGQPKHYWQTEGKHQEENQEISEWHIGESWTPKLEWWTSFRSDGPGSNTWLVNNFRKCFWLLQFGRYILLLMKKNLGKIPTFIGTVAIWFCLFLVSHSVEYTPREWLRQSSFCSYI